MGQYVIETKRGKRLTIESDSPENALKLADRWDLEDHAVSEAQRLGVKPDLALRQMQRESGGNPNAVSPKGARGPMQLMPGTARNLGVNPDDPYQNITGGLTYYKQQLDRFGGDERKALAAYNAGPGAVERAGGVPNYPETQAYVGALAGKGGAVPQRQVGSAAPVVPQRAPATLRPDDAVGFATGLGHVMDRGAGGLEFLASKVGLDKPINALGDALGLPTRQAVEDSHAAYVADQAAKGVRPGKLGEFAGNLAGTAWIPGGPLVQGALGGALTGNSKDAAGVAKDAAIGDIAGRVTAGLSDAAQLGARKLLSKVPQVMDIPALKQAVQDAYAKVDATGFVFPRTDVKALADDFARSVAGSALSKSAKDDAREIINYTRGLAAGDLGLSQLEKLRGDIYDAMVKKGGDTARLGGQFRAKIDALIDAVPNGDVRAARELNMRLKKTEYADRASRSADIAAERTYGGDYGRKLKDRMNPLIDPMMPQKNLRGGTPDELAAVEKIVRGTKTQNAASMVGGMLDPRRLGGKIVTGAMTAAGGAGAPFSMGASLLVPAAQMAAGMGLTAKASGIARANLDDLMRLFAVGGSRQALAPVPTKASQAAETAIAKLARPALVASAVPALAAARKPDPADKRKR